MTTVDEQSLSRLLLTHEVSAFLYEEARAMDERRYQDWFAMFDPNIRYWAPTRSNRWPREMNKEIAQPDGAAIFDEDWRTLSIRVRRLETQRAWNEYPASRTRHLVTNISAAERPDGDVTARSSFLAYVSRRELDEQYFFGSRVDRLTREPMSATWRIVEREVYLDHSTVLADGISIFF
ncbi:MAG: 3-phenylpropionate/cinnamic acid dioxygenase subunit beta [Microbacteriaceae bacterium]